MAEVTFGTTRRQRGAQRAAETRKRNKELGIKREKPKSRAVRWAEAASAAADAVQTLLDLQSEFESWRDNLPENLSGSNLGDKLDTVCDIDLQGALDAVQEAEGADLPLGFGRD